MQSRIISICIYVCAYISVFVFTLLFFKICKENKYIQKIQELSIKKRASNLSIVQKIELFIIKNYQLENISISPYFILLISVLISIVFFFISYKVLKIYSSAIILSICILVIPSIIIKYMKNRDKEKILNIFPTFLASLKNYTKTENDIVVALRRVKIEDKLYKYIKKFNEQVQNGVKIYDAFEEMKFGINIPKISELIIAFEYCYINGGNFTEIIDRYSKVLVKINMQREDEKQKALGTKIVLLVLILINVYMLFGFVFANPEYKNIIINSFFGRIIVNINIVSYIIIILFFQKMQETGE